MDEETAVMIEKENNHDNYITKMTGKMLIPTVAREESCGQGKSIEFANGRFTHLL